jgi:hypothetical protein
MIQEEQLKQSGQNGKGFLDWIMNQPVAIKYCAAQFSRIHLGIIESVCIRG